MSQRIRYRGHEALVTSVIKSSLPIEQYIKIAFVYPNVCPMTLCLLFQLALKITNVNQGLNAISMDQAYAQKYMFIFMNRQIDGQKIAYNEIDGQKIDKLIDEYNKPLCEKKINRL